jgi:hypothetical protein
MNDQAGRERSTADQVVGDAPIGRRRSVPAAVALALAGGLAITILGGLVGATLGLIAVAALTGWLVAVGLGRPTDPSGNQANRLQAAALALAGVAVGQIGLWVVAVIEGGVLDPIGYLIQVWGLLVPLQLLAALVVGALSARRWTSEG